MGEKRDDRVKGEEGSKNEGKNRFAQKPQSDWVMGCFSSYRAALGAADLGDAEFGRDQDKSVVFGFLHAHINT